jgi:branched-subunit amino acid ABC-type transport system permease component
MTNHFWDEVWRYAVIGCVDVAVAGYAYWVYDLLAYEPVRKSLLNRVLHTTLATLLVVLVAYGTLEFIQLAPKRESNYRDADRAVLMYKRGTLVRCFGAAPACQLTAAELARLDELNIDLNYVQQGNRSAAPENTGGGQ